MKNLSIMCYKKYSDLIKTLNSISDVTDVIEVGTQHRGEFVLLCTQKISSDELSAAQDSLQINDPHSSLLPAYFKQSPITVEKNMVVVESPQLSVLFEVTQSILSKSDFQCIEIQRSLTDTGLGYALFCNGSDVSVFQKITHAQVTILETPSATLKYFF